jgi:Sec-independent protein translocase protein TatA
MERSLRMGGFHPLDLLIVALIALAIFGPKTLQSLARSAGKGAGQAKGVKEKVMAELPLHEFSELSQHVPRVPLNSRQAVGMLLKSESEKPAARQVDEGGSE